ncbi:hypothetical protein PANO111632_02095 [Paracoccus nototheniae]|uniref:Uncharacterized protein n=1 Tax=Paracoccus nototheniae TaxID=2489002 RepID=A0ABW4DUW8_9RHOB|nr:hypothetical protein [Paracoccus nototheniae]
MRRGAGLRRHILPMQPGDVAATASDTTLLQPLTGARRHIPVANGLGRYGDRFHGYCDIRHPDARQARPLSHHRGAA